MTQAAQVREAVAGDTPAILAIAHTTAWDKDEDLGREILRGHVLVAETNETIVGFVAWNQEFFALPFVWLVAVSPQDRRTGVAARLFDAVEMLCAGKRLFCSTNLSHSLMQRFLEGRGYRRSGEIDLDPGDPEVFYQIELGRITERLC